MFSPVKHKETGEEGSVLRPLPSGKFTVHVINREPGKGRVVHWAPDAYDRVEHGDPACARIRAVFDAERETDVRALFADRGIHAMCEIVSPEHWADDVPQRLHRQNLATGAYLEELVQFRDDHKFDFGHIFPGDWIELGRAIARAKARQLGGWG